MNTNTLYNNKLKNMYNTNIKKKLINYIYVLESMFVTFETFHLDTSLLNISAQQNAVQSFRNNKNRNRQKKQEKN